MACVPLLPRHPKGPWLDPKERGGRVTSGEGSQPVGLETAWSGYQWTESRHGRGTRGTTRKMKGNFYYIIIPLAQRPWAEGRSTEARGSEAVGAEWPWPYSLYHRLSHSRGSFTRDFKAVAKRENLIWWSKQEGNNLTVPIIRSGWG